MGNDTHQKLYFYLKNFSQKKLLQKFQNIDRFLNDQYLCLTLNIRFKILEFVFSKYKKTHKLLYIYIINTDIKNYLTE